MPVDDSEASAPLAASTTTLMPAASMMTSAPAMSAATTLAPAALATTSLAAPAMSATTLAPTTAVGMVDSTSAPLIDASLAKGAAQLAEAPAPKKRKVTAPATVSDTISDK